MRYFMTGVRFTLMQRLGSIRNWIILLLLPALVLAVTVLTPETDASAPVCVGVVLPQSGGEEMWQLLRGRSDGVLEFISTDEETLERNIAAGRWDCGIILAEDFDQRAAELDTDRIFTLRIGPGSAVYPLVKETVCACMAQLIGPDIARDYLLESGIVSETPDDSQLGQTLAESDRVLVVMSTADGQPLPAPELTSRSTKGLLRWLICVSILVRMLFGAADLGKWMDSPGMRRTCALQSPLWTMAARAAADGLLLFISASLAMLILGEGLWGCAAVLGYVVFWLMVSLLLAQFPALTTVLHVSIPFAVVISLLLSSVLMDVSLIFPMLSPVSRWLPVSMYLRTCEGSPGDLLLLFCAGGLCLGLSWVVSICRGKISVR